MHVFYSTAFQGDKAILNEEESLHLSKVLRLKEGTNVLLLDVNYYRLFDWMFTDEYCYSEYQLWKS